MPRLSEIPGIVRDGNCMGCGFCTVEAKSGAPIAAVSMRYNEKIDYFAPETRSTDLTDDLEVVCPGARMDMVELAEATHGQVPDDYLLGQVRAIRVAYATDDSYREHSASGGFIPAALRYLFRSDAIDAAYVLDPGNSVDGAVGAVITDEQSIDHIHGSVYHPTRFGQGLADLLARDDRFAFVGLPCHIAALEQMKLANPALAARHKLSIGLFCGGINTFKGIAYYLRGFGVHWDRVRNIEYRYGHWPGRIRIQTDPGAPGPREIPRIRGNSRWKILRYVIAFQGYWMLRRCRVCPDQISDFADIAVGDPHLPKYRKQRNWGFSLVVSRSARGEQLVATMLQAGELAHESADRQTVISAQGYTLDNRRHLKAYLRINHWLGNRNPDIRLYPRAWSSTEFRHYVYAAVDLCKTDLPKWRLITMLYLPWQVFEYLFITFTPSIVIGRLKNLIRNK